MDIKLRQASESDMEQVHQLVFELATFEKAPDEVTTNSQIYIQDGFAEKRFGVIVAEDLAIPHEEKIIGIAFYYWAYSTWKGKYIWLDDLIVTERYRKYGIGKLLFNAVIKIALEENAGLLRWQVLDWNEPAIQFYRKYDALFQQDWLTCKLTKEQMESYLLTS